MLIQDYGQFYGIMFMLANCLRMHALMQCSVITASVPFSPIFITGFPRSGTTLVAAILDRHSSIAIPPETHFFEAMKLVDGEPSRSSSTTLVEYLLNTPRMRDLGLHPTDVYPFLTQRPFLPRDVFQAVLTAYRHRRGKPLIGEKTPGHLMHATQLLTWYPRSKMIFVLRDGRDAVASILNVAWRGHGIARLHAVTWRRYIQFAERMRRDFPDRFLFVKYEDILLHPEEQVSRLDNFCNVLFEPAQVDASIVTHVVPQWENAWKSLAAHPFDLSRVGRWRTEFSQDDQWALNHTMAPYLQQFGYDDHTLSNCPITRRLRLAATGLLLRTGETRRIYHAFCNWSGRQPHHANNLPANATAVGSRDESDLITKHL
jgi:hypothetical protein